ncbi:MAG: EamA/RhaT family transporter [Ruminococcaceae bacterium]|nr:EamA/RhaT family transporter [Oscillospiraceae bacterium]
MKFLKDARLQLTLSMVVFGTIGLFVRNIGLPSGEIALYRAVLATVLVGVVLLFTKQRIDFAKIKKELPLLLLSGVAMGFNWILLFEAYNYTTVSVATLSYYFAPVIVTLVCPLLFKEKMGIKQWLCFGFSTVGIVLITGIGDLSTGSNHIKGIAFGLGAAGLYATVILLNKFIKGVQGLHRTFLQFIAATAVLVPYVGFTSGCNLGMLDTKGWIFLLAVGIVHTGVTYCLYFSSLKELPGQKAAILSYVDPLVAVLCSVTLLHEKMTLLQIIGGLLILGFTLWNEIPTKNLRKNTGKR